MDSNPAWIEELLRNNFAPSDQAAQEVKRMLLKPLKDLEDLDAEILDLKQRLLELETKRNNIQKRISRYGLMLAPIRRVPADVLGDIFYRCLPTHRNPIMKSGDCPLLLTHVCSTWRATALSTPRLWERLYVTFTDDDTVPDLETAAEMARNGQNIDAGWQTAQSKSAKQETTELLRRRYEAVREWISRSGTRPLSMSMSFKTSSWYTVPYLQRPHSVTMEFLSFLATTEPRWREFEVKSSTRVYNVLEDMLSVSQMTALTSFRAEFDNQFPQVTETTRPLRVMEAPNLQRLSVSVADTRVWRIADRSFTQWNKLTRITCFNSLSVAETIFLFEHASNLVHYKGVISEHTGEIMPTVYEGHISLPFLQTLLITEYINPRRLGNVYDRIDAPRLQWFNYSSQLYPGEFSADSPTPIPILPLLRKSTELQKLSIDTNDFTTCDVGTLLRAAPSITHLVMGLEERSLFGTMMRMPSYIDYDTSGVLNRELWSFSDLIVGNSSEENDTPPLPRLTSLVVPSLNARITDDMLFDLIKSRMVPNGTAALEHVKVVFYRERERNILEELTRHAEDVGVKINLEFEYAQPPSSNAKPATSPEFGLTGPDERSWPYVDAGEHDLPNHDLSMKHKRQDKLQKRR